MLGTLIGVLLFTFNVTAYTGHHMIATYGKLSCLKSTGFNSRDKIKKLNITVRGDRGREADVIERVAETLIAHSGLARAKALIGNIRVEFHQKLRASTSGRCLPAEQLTPGVIKLARQCFDGRNVPYREMIAVHEFGHIIGNRLGLYNGYSKLERCPITRYGQTSYREEFAENFSAYVTAAFSLNRYCEHVSDYFSKSVFQQKTRLKCGP